LQHPKRKTIGLRVPDHPIVHELLEQLGEPIMSSTLLLPGKTEPETDMEAVREHLEKHVDLIIDGGNCGIEATTVIDLLADVPKVLRQGKGAVDMLELPEE
jgi:tRNA threonylcarbamoyl adenosine modification protein (Sua5/YciO/YrdC/YwlC family)